MLISAVILNIGNVEPESEPHNSSVRMLINFTFDSCKHKMTNMSELLYFINSLHTFQSKIL